MAKLSEIGFSIRNQLKGYFSSDDERIDIEHIYHEIHVARAVLLKEEKRKFGFIREDNYQICDCIQVNCDELECSGVKSGIIEFSAQLPPLLFGIAEQGIKYFGTMDGNHAFSWKSFTGFQYSDASTYTGKDPAYTIVSGKAFVKNFPGSIKKLCYLRMIAVLEDPSKGCTGTSCSFVNENSEYPIDLNLVKKIEIMTIKQLMSTLPMMPDESNNAKDTPSPAPEQTNQPQPQRQ